MRGCEHERWRERFHISEALVFFFCAHCVAADDHLHRDSVRDLRRAGDQVRAPVQAVAREMDMVVAVATDRESVGGYSSVIPFLITSAAAPARR